MRFLTRRISGKACGEECDNNRVYVAGLPTTVTEAELVEKFGSIGIIARIRQVSLDKSHQMLVAGQS